MTNVERWMWVTLVSTMACSCADAPATGQPPAGQSTTAAAGTPVVEPGKGIGPIRIGMTQAEVEATNLAVQKPQSEEWHAGPYRVLFEDGRVLSVEADLRELGGAVFGGATVAPDEHAFERIAASMPGCSKVAGQISC